MSYEFPTTETLARYQSLLMAVLVEARALAWSKASHDQIANLMDAVHNIPDLLCRWPDMDQARVLKDLLRYEQEYCAGKPRFTGILREGPRKGWQLRWSKTKQL